MRRGEGEMKLLGDILTFGGLSAICASLLVFYMSVFHNVQWMAEYQG